jgi:hypothetical protein
MTPLEPHLMPTAILTAQVIASRGPHPAAW